MGSPLVLRWVVGLGEGLVLGSPSTILVLACSEVDAQQKEEGDEDEDEGGGLGDGGGEG